MNNTPVSFSDKFPYLGVTLDNELSWKPHKANVILNAKRNIMKVSSKIRATCGIKPELARWLFCGIIRPKIAYASMTWAHTVNTQKEKEIFEKINRLAMYTFNPVRKTIATNSLEVIYDIMPLDIHLKYTAICTHRRLQHTLTNLWTGTNPKGTKVSHLQYWSNLINQFEIQYPDTDKCNLINWTKNFNINIPQDHKTDSFKNSLIQSQYTVYTDGSKTKTGTGAGYVIYLKQEKIKEDNFPLQTNATIFQAEILAIKKAANFLIKNKMHDQPKYIKIFSDSQAALQALDSYDIHSSIVQDTILTLNELGNRTKRLSLNWIKAHAGHKGNEEADQQARIAADITQEQETLKLSDNIVKQTIKGIFYSCWQNRWLSDTNFARHTKIFFPTLLPQKSKHMLKLEPKNLTNLIHAITGHNNLKYFSNKILPANSVNCRLCRHPFSIETFEHMLLECPTTANTFHLIFNSKNNCRTQDFWTPGTLLEFLHTKRIFKLFKTELRLQNT